MQEVRRLVGGEGVEEGMREGCLAKLYYKTAEQ